jgi:HSP20 family protein
MANLVRRGEGESAPARRQEWHPFRMMEEMLGWDPFRAMAPFGRYESGFAPSFEVKETRDGYVFKADLPGVKEADLDISVSGNTLTLSGKREAEEREEGETWYTYERSYGSFTRTFTLPEGANLDGASAELREGVLTVAIPKRAEAQPRKITVKAKLEGAVEKVKSVLKGGKEEPAKA